MINVLEIVFSLLLLVLLFILGAGVLELFRVDKDLY
jgi:hypothetical protein